MSVESCPRDFRVAAGMGNEPTLVCVSVALHTVSKKSSSSITWPFSVAYVHNREQQLKTRVRQCTGTGA
jgi:hypothetical protein